MIARNDSALARERTGLWGRLAAPLPAPAISWRQDGRPVARDGKYIARFVCYVDANTVRERLDGVVPGEWDLTLELLPALPGDEGEPQCSFKARLQILGVIREDVGTGRDYKAAATDAFKRAAVRFGIAHELYAFEQNWVQVDGDGRYARPLEDPAAAYARRFGTVTGASAGDVEASHVAGDASAGHSAMHAVLPADEPECPKCGGRMWDNRSTKRNPRAPDYKCRERSCDGVVWPGRSAAGEEVPVLSSGSRDRLVSRRTEEEDLPF